MKSKSAIIFTITGLLIVAIGFFFLRPVAASIWASWKDLAQAREDKKILEEKKKILESLKQNQNLSDVGQIALKYIPKDMESGELVIELTAMASANNLQVEETSLEKTKKESRTEEEEEAKKQETPATQESPASQPLTFKEVEFSMKLIGTFSDFLNFLRAIDSSSRLISLKNITLQEKQESGETKGSFSAQIAGSAYYKSEISLEESLENIQVSQETINKFLNLKTYGTPINLPSESGFGRYDPFESY